MTKRKKSVEDSIKKELKNAYVDFLTGTSTSSIIFTDTNYIPVGGGEFYLHVYMKPKGVVLLISGRPRRSTNTEGCHHDITSSQ